MFSLFAIIIKSPVRIFLSRLQPMTEDQVSSPKVIKDLGSGLESVIYTPIESSSVGNSKIY